MSRFGPGSRPERPSKGQELEHNQEKPPRRCFSHSGMNLTLRCQIYRTVVCVYMWQLWGSGREGGREEDRVRQTETEGQVEFRAESHTAGKHNCFRISASTPVPIFPTSSFLPFILPSFVFFFFFCSAPHLFSLFVFILALAAVCPAGWRGTG